MRRICKRFSVLFQLSYMKKISLMIVMLLFIKVLNFYCDKIIQSKKDIDYQIINFLRRKTTFIIFKFPKKTLSLRLIYFS